MTVSMQGIGKLVESSYLDYGIYVNNYRAIPAIDGFKPVYRRILLATRDVATDSFCKTSRVLGEVIGKWHPHGDAAVAPVVSFLVRSGILLGQGNHGTALVDEAAPRYTEVKFRPELDDLFFKLARYSPTFENELGNTEPEYLITPIPLALMIGNSGIGVGVTTRNPAFSYKSLIEAYRENNPKLLRSYYGYRIVDADWETLWSKGHGKMTLQYAVNRRHSNEDGREVTIIEGNGEVFKPALRNLVSLENQHVFIRNESKKSIKYVVGRTKGTRTITDNDLYQTILNKVTQTRRYHIKINVFGEVREIGIKDWLDVTMGLSQNALTKWKKDKVNDLETLISEYRVIPDVSNLLQQNRTNEEISSKLGISKEVVTKVASRPLSFLRRSTFDEEIDKANKKITEIGSVTLDSILDAVNL